MARIREGTQRPPTHSAREVFQIISARAPKEAIERLGGKIGDSEEDDNAAAFNVIRLRELRFRTVNDVEYAEMLFEHVNDSERSFPVVRTDNFEGREIAGEEIERGASTAHVVVRLPPIDAYDDGEYRCTIEVVAPITRAQIEYFFSRQMRRHCTDQEWDYSEVITKRGSKPRKKSYRYWVKIHLNADVGRSLISAGSGGKTLTSMLFTKRKVRRGIGQATEVVHEDVIADVNIKISARQGPSDAQQQRIWYTQIRRWYEDRGFNCRLFFRGPSGTALSGGVDHAVAGAADLIMCPREQIILSEAPKRWRASIDEEVVAGMRKLLDRDDLWAHGS
jgi:hypothetical protein